MGIYIPGMEMPKNCEGCLCRTKDAFGGLGCQATGYIPLRKANQDHPDWCPLIPVPPHGRLKDADALLKSDADYEHPLFDTDGSWDCVVLCYDRDTIKDAPTIIPADPAEEESFLTKL